MGMKATILDDQERRHLVTIIVVGVNRAGRGALRRSASLTVTYRAPHEQAQRLGSAFRSGAGDRCQSSDGGARRARRFRAHAS